VKKITIINIFFIYPPHCIVALSNLAIPNNWSLRTTVLDVLVSDVPLDVPLDELLDELFLQDEIVRVRNKISKMNKTLFIFSIHQK
tara:strand:- start:34 stop:291 length:258 start_codon:yes stop_codon:yes gene_type:complete